MDELLQEFIAETRETLEALSGEIVAWEANPTDRARLDAIFRFVHTVKGSCGFLDLPRLARLSHAAEDVLAAVRDGKRAPDTQLVNAVLAIVDRIGEIVEAIDAGHALDDSAEDLLIAALAEDAAPAIAAGGSGNLRAPTRSVRLNVELLDRMMSGMSDMVLARNELARRMREGDADPRTEAALERLSATVAEMRDTVTRTRMQKIEALFSALPRMVRDTAASLGKAVQLQIEGADVELDREMIEMMRDPLVHIIRNAIDHGVEAPAVRREAGKRETGRLRVSARQSGNRIMIEVADDGAGIDVGRVVAKAAKVGLHDVQTLAAMPEAAKLDLIFAPGLSSRDVASDISGRGVGMDVVRANVEQIGGRVSLDNRPGRGLTVVMEVPLTLSILSTIVVGAGGERYALPRQTVEEIVTVRGDAVRVDLLGDTPVVTVRGVRLPLVDLAGLLDLRSSLFFDLNTMIIVATRDGAFALAVDEVIDTEELVVKPAAPAIMATGLYAGQTLPDSGRPMLLLDGAGVAAYAGLRFGSYEVAEEQQAEQRQGAAALLFQDLDGRRRAIALACVDRVETVSADAISHTAGRLRLAVEERLLPLHANAPVAEGREATVLRLTDGAIEVGYAIAEPIDIVELPAELAPALDPRFMGVAVIGDEQVEVVDPITLFVHEPDAVASAPLCLLQPDEGGWMETFLRGTLEAAGYRCVTRLAPGEQAAVALTLDAAPVPAVPTVHLSRDRAGADGVGTVYRYDRDALLAAVSARIQSKRAA
ncbi:chemotaxis protein CheW [Sphingomonas lenta]|uniref:Chemotaxis protein CheA n=1 Tax=Sphingomonas lenta TaxID=1141887 RepID=A0A2A2SKP9_9SPHN|nr:chemotaxis protein CheW [Sphingomonas lenta]PAX09803.1 chemotaxis protein CheA [Sphingomonas lenta]